MTFCAWKMLRNAQREEGKIREIPNFPCARCCATCEEEKKLCKLNCSHDKYSGTCGLEISDIEFLHFKLSGEFDWLGLPKKLH